MAGHRIRGSAGRSEVEYNELVKRMYQNSRESSGDAAGALFCIAMALLTAFVAIQLDSNGKVVTSNKSVQNVYASPDRAEKSRS